MADPKAYEQNHQPSIEDQLAKLKVDREKLIETFDMNNTWARLNLDALDKKIAELEKFLHYESGREVAES